MSTTTASTVSATLLLLALVGSPAAAPAQGAGSILAELQYTIRVDEMRQRRVREGEIYAVAESFARTTTAVAVNGQPQGETTAEEESLPAEGTYDHVQLTRTQEGRGIEANRLSFFVGDELVELETEVEIELTAGTWEAFDRGEPVSYRYTEEGLAQRKSGLAEKIRKSALPAMEAAILQQVGLQVGAEAAKTLTLDSAVEIGLLPNQEPTVTAEDHSVHLTEPMEFTLTIRVSH